MQYSGHIKRKEYFCISRDETAWEVKDVIYEVIRRVGEWLSRSLMPEFTILISILLTKASPLLNTENENEKTGLE
jgi:hypothetical protein